MQNPLTSLCRRSPSKDSWRSRAASCGTTSRHWSRAAPRPHTDGPATNTKSIKALFRDTDWGRGWWVFPLQGKPDASTVRMNADQTKGNSPNVFRAVFIEWRFELRSKGWGVWQPYCILPKCNHVGNKGRANLIFVFYWYFLERRECSKLGKICFRITSNH